MKTIIAFFISASFALTGASAASILSFNPNKSGVISVSDATGYKVSARNGFYFTTTGSEITIIFDRGDGLCMAEMSFAAVLGQPLKVGTYTDLVEYPSNRPFYMTPGKNGMRFAYDSHGANILKGTFTILEIERDQDGNLTKAAIDFKFLAQANPNYWTEGSIRFNSTVPLPEPGAPILMMTSLLLVWRRRRR